MRERVLKSSPKQLALISGSDKTRTEQIQKMRAVEQKRKKLVCVWKGDMRWKWRRKMAVGGWGGVCARKCRERPDSVPQAGPVTH